MKRISKSTLAFAAAVVLASGALWAPVSEAAQDLCFRCVYIWFNGTYCSADGNEGPTCFDTPTGCHINQADCNTLTVVSL